MKLLLSNLMFDITGFRFHKVLARGASLIQRTTSKCTWTVEAVLVGLSIEKVCRLLLSSVFQTLGVPFLVPTFIDYQA